MTFYDALTIMYGKNIIYWLSALLATVILLFFINFKDLKKFFSKVKKKYWLFLLVLLVAQGILFYFFQINNQVSWREARVAKAFYIGQIEDYITNKYSNSYPYGPLYPYALYLSFLVFGLNPFLQNMINIFFVICSSLVIFLLSYSLFKEEIPALLSVMLFIILTHNEFFFVRGFPSVVTFFVSLSTLIFFIAYKVKKPAMYALAMLVMLLTFLTRNEIVILLPMFLFGYALFTKDLKNIKKNLTKLFIPIIIFLIFFGICVHRYFYALKEIAHSNIEKSIFIPYFNSENFSDNIKAFKNFWFSNFLFTSLIFILGVIFSIRSYPRILIWLIIGLFLLNLNYLFYVNGYQDRFAAASFTYYSIIGSLGLYSLIWLSKKLKKNSNLYIAIFLIFTILFFSWYKSKLSIDFLNYQPTLYFPFELEPEPYLKDKINKTSEIMILVPDDYYDGVWEYIFLHKVVDVRSLIYNTPLFMEYDFIHPAIFTGRTQELQNMREDIFVNASKEIYNAYKANLTEEEMSRYLLDIPFAKGNNYYIHTSMCENESYNLLCRIIEENYNLSIVYEKNDIILYKFVR